MKINKIQKKLDSILSSQGKFYSLKLYAIELKKLLKILAEAANTKNSAEFIYTNDARTPLFMLEGLSRIHENINHKKIFRKLRMIFKNLEDALGLVNYYDNFQSLTKEKGFDPKITAFFQNKYHKALGTLNKLIIKSGWIIKKKEKASFPVFKDILDYLDKGKPEKFSKERKKFIEFIISTLKEIEKDIKKGNYDFEDLEAGVHEFRRNIRWFSIYAHGLQGLIQLKSESQPIPQLKDYCTEGVVNSPFNKMAPFQGPGKPINISASVFYALSYVIDIVGDIKDNAQFREAVDQALKSMEMKNPELHEKTLTKIICLVEPEESILHKSKNIIEEYILKKQGLKLLRKELKKNL